MKARGSCCPTYFTVVYKLNARHVVTPTNLSVLFLIVVTLVTGGLFWVVDRTAGQNEEVRVPLLRGRRVGNGVVKTIATKQSSKILIKKYSKLKDQDAALFLLRTIKQKHSVFSFKSLEFEYSFMWQQSYVHPWSMLTWLMGSCRNKMPFLMELLMSFSE